MLRRFLSDLKNATAEGIADRLSALAASNLSEDVRLRQDMREDFVAQHPEFGSLDLEFGYVDPLTNNVHVRIAGQDLMLVGNRHLDGAGNARNFAQLLIDPSLREMLLPPPPQPVAGAAGRTSSSHPVLTGATRGGGISESFKNLSSDQILDAFGRLGADRSEAAQQHQHQLRENLLKQHPAFADVQGWQFGFVKEDGGRHDVHACVDGRAMMLRGQDGVSAEENAKDFARLLRDPEVRHALGLKPLETHAVAPHDAGESQKNPATDQSAASGGVSRTDGAQGDPKVGKRQIEPADEEEGGDVNQANAALPQVPTVAKGLTEQLEDEAAKEESQVNPPSSQAPVNLQATKGTA